MTGLGELIQRLNLANNSRCSTGVSNDTTYGNAEQQTCDQNLNNSGDMFYQYQSSCSRSCYYGDSCEDAPDVEAISTLSSNDSIVDVDSSSLYLYCGSSESSQSNLIDTAEEEDDDSSAKHELSSRSVQFSHIEVREYEIELGDCPYCSYGPPISLGWAYSSSSMIEIDEYERSRSTKMCRKGKELVLTLYQRKNLLRQFGYTNVDFRRFEPGLATSRMRRSGTSLNLATPSL